MTQLLDDFVGGLGDEPMSVQQFQATIEAGLEAFSLPLIPPVVDQVVVGSVDRSRQPDITAAFVLGFNEGLFPHRPAADVMLGDQDRDLLSRIDEACDLMTGRQKLFDERLLAYIALTRASRYVWVSYALSDENGKTLSPSPYLRALQMSLPGLKARHLPDPLVCLDVEQVGTAWQGATGVVLAGRSLCSEDSVPGDGDSELGDEGSSPATQHSALSTRESAGLDEWIALARRMNADAVLAGQIRRVASACDYGNACTIRPGQAASLLGDRIACSVSQLQEYAVCPYRYFAHYVLRLQERPEFESAAVESGSFYHRILYRIATGARQQGRSLRTLPHEALVELVSRTTDEELRAVTEELPMTGGREAYLLDRAKVDINTALRGHLALWKDSMFDPAALEVGFGIKDGPPALTLVTPKGRAATLRGKIDRIDAASLGEANLLAVIDYKRSSRYRLRLDMRAGWFADPGWLCI